MAHAAYSNCEEIKDEKEVKDEHQLEVCWNEGDDDMFVGC